MGLGRAPHLTLIMWLIFLGYVMMRDYIDDQKMRERLSAVLGIIGASMVPFVYFSTRWFEVQHPKPVVMGDAESGIKDPNMVIALLLALAAFTLLYLFLWRRGTELAEGDAKLSELRMRMNALEEEA